MHRLSIRYHGEFRKRLSVNESVALVTPLLGPVPLLFHSVLRLRKRSYCDFAAYVIGYVRRNTGLPNLPVRIGSVRLWEDRAYGQEKSIPDNRNCGIREQAGGVTRIPWCTLRRCEYLPYVPWPMQ